MSLRSPLEGIVPIDGPAGLRLIDLSLACREGVRGAGAIFKEDPLGWFQWYCRFCNGRRISHIDEIQIKRWKNFKRHVIAIEKNCETGDLSCRKRQRQAILQWAYNPFI